MTAPISLAQQLADKLDYCDRHSMMLRHDDAQEIMCFLRTPAAPPSAEPPRCPKCGYTYEDCRFHMDHHLCGEPEPPPAPAPPSDGLVAEIDGPSEPEHAGQTYEQLRRERDELRFRIQSGACCDWKATADHWLQRAHELSAEVELTESIRKTESAHQADLERQLAAKDAPPSDGLVAEIDAYLAGDFSLHTMHEKQSWPILQRARDRIVAQRRLQAGRDYQFINATAVRDERIAALEQDWHRAMNELAEARAQTLALEQQLAAAQAVLKDLRGWDFWPEIADQEYWLKRIDAAQSQESGSGG
jgi:hypothetical protein